MTDFLLILVGITFQLPKWSKTNIFCEPKINYFHEYFLYYLVSQKRWKTSLIFETLPNMPKLTNSKASILEAKSKLLKKNQFLICQCISLKLWKPTFVGEWLISYQTLLESNVIHCKPHVNKPHGSTPTIWQLTTRIFFLTDKCIRMYRNVFRLESN